MQVRILLLSLIAAFALSKACAQHREGGQRPDSTSVKMPAVGKVSGVVADSAGRRPAAFASVALIRVRDSVPVAGTLSDEKGNFLMSEVPAGRFFLRISSIGFRDYYGSQVIVRPDHPVIDLGTIYLAPSVSRLKEVNVTGEREDYINSLDKKVYNLDKNIVNTGGTATEVLRNIPSVNVDMDGNVSLRGSANVTILIDGKPSGITGNTRQAVLQQVPASGIERIEVITNPSAKYDADGMAGIINIVTKKDKLKGLNANLSIGAGTNDKYNAAAGGNFRTRHMNVYANYSYRHERRTVTGESERANYYGDSITYNLSSSHGSNVSDAHLAKAGVDFYLNEYNTLGAGVTLSKRKESRPDYVDYVNQNLNRELTSAFTRENEDHSDHTSIDYNLDFRKTFRRKKGEWSASAVYSSTERKSRHLPSASKHKT